MQSASLSLIHIFATIMALTMCPTWALADDEGVTTLPDIENSVPVVDSAPAVDPTEDVYKRQGFQPCIHLHRASR